LATRPVASVSEARLALPNVSRQPGRGPDLIVAIYSDISQADHGKLSRLAPTIAAPKGYV
jgi:iron complex transport system substrate-binding protein